MGIRTLLKSKWFQYTSHEQNILMLRHCTSKKDRLAMLAADQRFALNHFGQKV